jgi:copper homeostasis protein
MILEVIAGSVEDALAAERGGATRIELCVDLDQDGLTPPLPLVGAVAAAVHIPVRVMLRRRNDFLMESADALADFCSDAQSIQRAGAEGLVLGFIQEGRVDERALERISKAAPDLKITFHRAFDALADERAALETQKRFQQVDCILTSGGAGPWPQRAERLKQLQAQASPQIEVLVGGGVDAAAIGWLRRHTSLCAFHAGRAARENNAVNGRVLEERVRALADVLHKRKEKRDLNSSLFSFLL